MPARHLKEMGGARGSRELLLLLLLLLIFFSLFFLGGGDGGKVGYRSLEYSLLNLFDVSESPRNMVLTAVRRKQ